VSYQSESDIRRMQERFKRTIIHLGQFEESARENKDLFLSRGDVGEHEYNTAVVVYRHVRLAHKRILHTQAEVLGLSALLQEEAAGAADKSEPLLKQISKSAFVMDQMKQVSSRIADVLQVIEQRMALPKSENSEPKK
jgi:hypothetical protein